MNGFDWSTLVGSRRFKDLPTSAPKAYARIMAAADDGRAVRLSPGEVRAMSLDDAIETAASHLFEEDER